MSRNPPKPQLSDHEFRKLVVTVLQQLNSRLESVESNVDSMRSSPDDSMAGCIYHKNEELKQLVDSVENS